MTTAVSPAQTPPAEVEEILEFNQLKLRLYIGVMAFILPSLTLFVSSTPLSSISASYYTAARDYFVGVLFTIGTLLWAYTGPLPPTSIIKSKNIFIRIANKFLYADEKNQQGILSTLGAFAAFFAAIFPTACDTCKTNYISIIHYVAAAVLFSTIAYFCLVVFRNHAIAKEQERERKRLSGAKQRLRARFYLLSGWGIIGSMISALVGQIIGYPVTFLAEASALLLFSLSWLIASRHLNFFTDPEERPVPVSKDIKEEVEASA